MPVQLKGDCMMGFWILGAAGVIMLTMSVLSERKNFRRGFERGYDAGFEAGHAAGSNWFLEAEKQIDEERQKIWREEA